MSVRVRLSLPLEGSRSRSLFSLSFFLSIAQKVGNFRLVMNYICPFKSIRETNKMQMALVEGGHEGEGSDPLNESQYNEVDVKLKSVLYILVPVNRENRG